MEPTEVEQHVQALKERLESAVRAAEEASSKANSESGFAFNAKQNAEEHARSIAQIKGIVDADQTWFATTKKNVDEWAAAVNTSKTAAESDVKATSELRNAIEKESQSIRGSSERAAAVVALIEKHQADVSALSADVHSAHAAVVQSKATTEASAAAVQALQAQVSESALKANSLTESMEKAEVNALDIVALLDGERKLAKEATARVQKYEEELIALKRQATELHQKIESLLPNATSAGLASAFRNQQVRFKSPQRNWLLTFIVSVALLLGAGFVGLPGLWPGAVREESWDAILRHFVSRLPLIVPLVWVAIFAGRNYMLALRVEEEYAFKEALSTAFEGYKREMADVPMSESGAQSPLVILCDGVLQALSARPGRIYEGNHDDITPLTPLAKTLSEAVASFKSASTSPSK
jgi:hypothetical protein